MLGTTHVVASRRTHVYVCSMKRRTRIFAFLALTAMTGALAEGVLASVCVPGMDMGGGAMSMDTGVPNDDMTGGADRSERQHLPDDGSDCPFAPVAAQGCLAMASIPSSGTVVVASAGDDCHRVAFDDEQYDLLLHRALFHPPRS